MSDPAGYSIARAYLDEQHTVLGDWSPTQLLTLHVCDDYDELDGVDCSLTAQEARGLAWRLIELAEHADRRAEGDT
ncbi:MAG: hypothetical protein M3401_19195 [Actinomycetota bacterium]|nr:hypothetical protein [Actinomycetota bacterium]